jgi:hypothetical protein
MLLHFIFLPYTLCYYAASTFGFVTTDTPADSNMFFDTCTSI